MATLLLFLPLLLAALSLATSRRAWLENLNTLGAVVVAGLGFGLAARVAHGGVVWGLGDRLYLDALSAFEVAIAVGVGFAVQLYARGYMGRELDEGRFPPQKLKRFYALVNLYLFAFLLVCLANNLGAVWIAIEGTTLATAFLVAFYNGDSAIEAAWKYFLLCTVGISLALMGVLLLYFSARHLPGPTALNLDWSWLASHARALDPRVLKLAFVFTLIGYGTKVGLAPMHTWLPDAHSEAPSPVSALLSGMLLNGAMYGVIRAHALVVRCVGEGFSNHLLVGFGLLSIVVAVPFVLWQRDVKRLLAYSSVEHMGIVSLGLGFGGPLGITGALLHTLYHSLLKTGMFFSAGNLVLKYHTRDLQTTRGALRALPLTGPAVLLGAFAIAGAPPFGLFFSEFTILMAGFSTGQWGASLVLLAALGLVFAGLVSHFARVGLGERPEGLATGETSHWTTAPLLGLMAIAAVTGLYLPPPVLHLMGAIVGIVRGVGS
ncbi:MAG TPA: hydrogenase 4 subunit F [Oscillatoriaceae cyanobacterium]